MQQDILSDIRARQKFAKQPVSYHPAVHQPEMLYIGCIDARLDPIADIGIPRGKALIYRNIGALVLKEPKSCSNEDDFSAVIRNGEIPENIAIGAALEFFIKHIPYKEGTRKHIVVSGHTDCGGVKACLRGVDKHQTPYLSTYLTTLQEVRDAVNINTHLNELEKHHRLEEDSVRLSLENLMGYNVVKEAILAGTLEVHGWLINTATSHISELEPKSGRFIEMSKWQSVA